MKYAKQLIRHDPENGQQGDCFRTALACLLDLEPAAVPHFMEAPGEPLRVTCRRVDRWLREHHGLRLISIRFEADSLDEYLRQTEAASPGLRYKVSGSSPRGNLHTVIVEEGRITWDPHPDGGGLVGPGDDGCYWMDFLLPVAVHGERP